VGVRTRTFGARRIQTRGVSWPAKQMIPRPTAAAPMRKNIRGSLRGSVPPRNCLEVISESVPGPKAGVLGGWSFRGDANSLVGDLTLGRLESMARKLARSACFWQACIPIVDGHASRASDAWQVGAKASMPHANCEQSHCLKQRMHAHALPRRQYVPPGTPEHKVPLAGTAFHR